MHSFYYQMICARKLPIAVRQGSCSLKGIRYDSCLIEWHNLSLIGEKSASVKLIRVECCGQWFAAPRLPCSREILAAQVRGNFNMYDTDINLCVYKSLTFIGSKLC